MALRGKGSLRDQSNLPRRRGGTIIREVNPGVDFSKVDILEDDISRDVILQEIPQKFRVFPSSNPDEKTKSRHFVDPLELLKLLEPIEPPNKL